VLGKHLWTGPNSAEREVRGRATESAEDDGVTQLEGRERDKSRTFDCRRN
jgi:hypothetical protein